MGSKLPGSWIIIEFAEIAQCTLHSHFENREREWVCLVVNARSRRSRWRGPSWRYKELETVEVRRNGTKDKDKKGSRRRYMEPVRNAIWLGPASSWCSPKSTRVNEFVFVIYFVIWMGWLKGHDRPNHGIVSRKAWDKKDLPTERVWSWRWGRFSKARKGNFFLRRLLWAPMTVATTSF